MNKREFIKKLTGTTLGLAALAALPDVFATPHHAMPKKADRISRSKRDFPNVPLLTHKGKLVHFYDDLIKNKTVMINFMYVRCGDICPGMCHSAH